MSDIFENDNEAEVRATLSEKRKEIKSFDELTEFIKDISEHYNIGYGSCVVAIAQAALATADYIADEFGITGFQASGVMWEFIRGWTDIGQETGAKILDYDKMLYPQYDDVFEKTISKLCWGALQKKAKEFLEAYKDSARPKVVAHWQSIVDGNVPFGYTVEDN